GCKAGGCNGVGLYDIGANNYYIACHFTGQRNNVVNGDGGTEGLFLGCNFEQCGEHNILLDCGLGGLQHLRIIGCQFNCNSLNSPDQWDAIHITRSSGSKTCSAIIEGNNFAASGEIKPRHHITLSGAAANG